ncbi:Uncharacterized protein HZ326_25455 [Fusarium oxysporum f. sp. albedinis]|nr:Uncharacterized protein HZ326_25455 [Fusarium oxysporum f. sp. albedinis]
MSTIETGPPLHTLGDRITDLVTEQRFGVVETDEMFESDLTVMLPKAKEAAQQANDEDPRKSYIIPIMTAMITDSSLQMILSGTVFVSTIYSAAIVWYRLYLHPLSKYPGPF